MRWCSRVVATERSHELTVCPKAGLARSLDGSDPVATTPSSLDDGSLNRSPTARRSRSKTRSFVSASCWPKTASTPARRRSSTTSQLIHYVVPSVSTIYRVLRRRGFITPEPHKRPRSSWIRFEAALPNECWQSDVTHGTLADDAEVEIINFIDDYSRVVLASRAVDVATSRLVLRTFHEAAKRWGFPASVLSDNGAVYTASYRGGRSAMESELLGLGILFKHSRPYHPQTCGKVERFHQTLKIFLTKQPRAATIEALQAQIDRFSAYYNEVRPHRARGRITPKDAFDSRDKARPSGAKINVANETRVRHDKVDGHGAITIRHRSKLHHIGIGRDFVGTRVIVLVDGLDIRILREDGESLRQLTLDPSKDYQGTGRPPGPPKGRLLGPKRKRPSTMP
jgi:transposase InsO family protein